MRFKKGTTFFLYFGQGVGTSIWGAFKSIFQTFSKKQHFFKPAMLISLIFATLISCNTASEDALKRAFKNPPDSSNPGVYWYFMDGNLSREEMTKDLESMKEVGISNLVFLEVGIGVPRGPVEFMSEEWQDLFVHAVREAERLGIKILLGAGPGWCGSGGPWVRFTLIPVRLVNSL